MLFEEQNLSHSRQLEPTTSASPSPGARNTRTKLPRQLSWPKPTYMYTYTSQNRLLTAIDTTANLGITRMSDSVFSKQWVASKTAKVAGSICKIFRSRAPPLIRLAFQPLVSYCSQIWNPVLRRNIDLIELIIRTLWDWCFDEEQDSILLLKSIRRIRNLSYSDRLSSLRTLSLQNYLLHGDLVTIYYKPALYFKLFARIFKSAHCNI